MTTRRQTKPHFTDALPPRFHALPQVCLPFEGSFCVAPLPNYTVTPLAAKI